LPSLYQEVIEGKGIGISEAQSLFQDNETPLWDLVYHAGRIHQYFFKNRVHLCAIINAKSGGCTEDCAFCAQSSRHAALVEKYPLVSLEHCMEAARRAEALGVRCFSLVTSGKTIHSRGERKNLKATITAIRNSTRLQVAVSLGTLSLEELQELKEAGLTTYHHNLETAPSFYPRVCTTHLISERINTIMAARDAGLTVCAGGIFGMGEDPSHRAEFALLLRDLQVQRIPVNFLNPIPGTPMGDRQRLRPLECIRIIAALRFILPDRDIIVCGGREVSLRSLQPLLFFAGANGMMTGDYLTTKGQAPEADLEMIRDLEREIVA
jgi:biotin synthase